MHWSDGLVALTARGRRERFRGGQNGGSEVEGSEGGALARGLVCEAVRPAGCGWRRGVLMLGTPLVWQARLGISS